MSMEYCSVPYILPLKIFVKERDELPNANTEKDKSSELNFKGNEAREAYEEIISHVQSQHSSKTVQPKKIQSRNCNKPSKKIQVSINALFKAVEQGDEKLIKEQVNPNNVNIQDQFGWTLLMSSVVSGHLGITKKLLELGANKALVEKSGMTALQLALKNNNDNMVDLLRRYNLRTRSNKKTLTVVEDEDSDALSSFYCQVCKVNFEKTAQKKHDSSTLHIFNLKPKIDNTFYGISKQNKGYQIMLRRGWDDKSGLGSDKKGRRYPIKTVFKKDRIGLGHPNKSVARVTHTVLNEPGLSKTRKTEKQIGKKDLLRSLEKEKRKEIAIRRALS